MSPVPSEVCKKCGWYGHGQFDINPCDEPAGNAANAVIDALPEVPSTKLGYGYRSFVFDIDPTFHIHLEVDRYDTDKTFSLRDVWCIDHLSHDDAVDLVKTLVEWRARRKAARQ